MFFPVKVRMNLSILAFADGHYRGALWIRPDDREKHHVVTIQMSNKQDCPDPATIAAISNHLANNLVVQLRYPNWRRARQGLRFFVTQLMRSEGHDVEADNAEADDRAAVAAGEAALPLWATKAPDAADGDAAGAARDV